MEEELAKALLASTGVRAIVGDRVGWLVRPQATGLPAVVMQVVSNPISYTLRGRDGLVGPLVQVDCWAATYVSAKALSRAVVAVLDTLTDPPFLGAFVETERDGFEPGDSPQTDNIPNAFFRASLDVRVWRQAAA